MLLKWGSYQAVAQRDDMGWEERKGKYYYYEKRREGGRVVSKYVGTGSFAEMCAVLNESGRESRRLDREALRQEREALDRQAGQVKDVLDQIRALTHAALIAGGCHLHKGQWRKCREHRESR